MVIKVPNRNILSVVAHGDQQTIKFLEDVATAINSGTGGTVLTGSGGLLDMGDRITAGSEYDGGARV